MSWKFTHFCGFVVFNGRQQAPFQKSQIHNPKHSQYKARVKTSPTYISENFPAYGKLSQACGEMKSPIGGSKHMGNMPHSPHLPCGEGLQGSLLDRATHISHLRALRRRSSLLARVFENWWTFLTSDSTTHANNLNFSLNNEFGP